MKLTDLLDQIDRLDQEATKGPWEAVGRPYNTCVSPVGKIRNLARLGDPLDPEAWKNAEFIALARTVLPQLAKALHAVMDLEDESLEGDLQGYEIDQYVGYNQALRSIREAITDAMEEADD